MSLWKNQHLKYVFGALLLITYTSLQTLSAKWFNDIRDLESLEKYSYAKARSYQARAEAFNQGTWTQIQFSRLAELWTSLPSIYQTPEDNLVGEHNRAVDEKIKLATEIAQRDGKTLGALFFLQEEYQYWTKANMVNDIGDEIIKIKLFISQQKKFRPHLVRTHALTEDYRKAKSEQYLALSQAAFWDKSLSKLYLKLSEAWANSHPDEIGARKLEIIKMKYEQSFHIRDVAAQKLENENVRPYPYNLPEKPIQPFFLRSSSRPLSSSLQTLTIAPLIWQGGSFPYLYRDRFVFWGQTSITDSIFWPLLLTKVKINQELIRVAGISLLPKNFQVEFYTEVKQGWLFSTKTLVPQKDEPFWKNHLFYSDYLKSEFGITLGESSKVIKKLMI